MEILITALLTWAFTGVVIAALLSRHGHSFWLFAAIGLAYGPFLVLIWFKAARGQDTQSIFLRKTRPMNESGWIDVLVGLDGSSEAIESAGQVLETLGQAVRRVRLTSVLDHEIANSPDAFTTDDQAIAMLQDAADAIGIATAELSVISGQPDKALAQHGEANGFDLLIVANRRHKLVGDLRGSTVGRLARSASLPVLIGAPSNPSH